MAEIDQNIYISTGKQADNTRQDRRKARQKWGAAETSLLVEGLYEHGVGNWKKILTDPKYPFREDRTAVDLKDRLYFEHYIQMNMKVYMVTFAKKPHRPKNKFTPEEDNALKLGVEKV
ncbi:2253_t:CDS:2 [Rhizophagus irregularis]|nr:2253_t:CDS:2 [Rhizophagus irregularis]